MEAFNTFRLKFVKLEDRMGKRMSSLGICFFIDPGPQDTPLKFFEFRPAEVETHLTFQWKKQIT